MRIDVVTIFGDYFAPLSLSLVGKAISSGLVDVAVHDLREWTHDRHRSVDDTPYGGGAGMVMKPQPWGEALDALLDDAAHLLVMSPSGVPFDQALATELATEQHLVLACGRYEGIDARVVEDARRRGRVSEVSLGDYVLNGGEVAALAVIEAVVRLIPGVVGNPASLTEESHAAEHDGLLEYPVYTKPPLWRELAVPEVLFSGHHAAIAAWRRAQALALTAQRRPDLLPPSEITISRAVEADAGELLTLQRAAFVVEAQVMNAPFIPPLTQTLEGMRSSIDSELVLSAVQRGRIVGMVLGRPDPDGFWYVGRLAVAPDLQRQGLGGRLLAEIEALAPAEAVGFRLQTGDGSTNTAYYERRGYSVVRHIELDGVPVVVLEKPRIR